MDQKLNSIMAQVFEYESNGDYMLGAKYIEKMIYEYPELNADLLYECSMLYFRNKMYYPALKGLIKTYKLTNSEDILNFIFEAYINPNQETYNRNYEKNIELLKKYQYLFSEQLEKYTDLNIKIVWKDEKRVIYIYNNDFVEKTFIINNIEKKKESLFINLIETNEIRRLELELDISYSHISPFKKSPMYLCYSEELFYILLCNDYYELSEIIKKDRIVFLVGFNNIQNYFSDIQTILPEKIYICIEDKRIFNAIINAIRNLAVEVSKFKDTDRVRISNYYLDKKDEIKNNIKSGKFKMIIITSLLTTAAQYHVKNLQYVAKKMGIETFFLIEKSPMHTLSNISIWKTIEEFHPDVILLVDHFRFELLKENVLLDNVVFLNWVQDPLSIIMSKDTPNKLIERDFILNHFITWKPFFRVGYLDRKIIEAPIPSNPEIYKPYSLTVEEEKRYGSEICFVCNSSDFNHCLKFFIESIDEVELGGVIYDMCNDYFQIFKEKEIFFYTEKECQNYTRQYLELYYARDISTELINKIGYWMFYDLNEKLFRQVLVDWLLEAGYTNIKLWGNGWLYEEKYKKYAMGIANNGEELSKILQASKIVIGNNFICTGAARIWETMLSGGFFLSTYVPREIDSVDIRTILNEDEYVMFRDKKDLIDKVSYYLKNEEERKFMAKKGRDRALEKMTFDVLMKRIVDELAKRL